VRAIIITLALGGIILNALSVGTAHVIAAIGFFGG